MKLSNQELEIINYVIKKSGLEIEEITRVSEEQFDIKIGGYNATMHFIGYLPLMLIRTCDWSDPDFASLSDYPEMAKVGDWSGIRDSSNNKIWIMFREVRRDLILSKELRNQSFS